MGKEFLAVKRQLHVEIVPSSQWNKKPPRPSPDAWDSSRRGPGAVTVLLLLRQLPAKVVAGEPGAALPERWHGAAALPLLFQLRWINNTDQELLCPPPSIKIWALGRSCNVGSQGRRRPWGQP